MNKVFTLAAAALAISGMVSAQTPVDGVSVKNGVEDVQPTRVSAPAQHRALSATARPFKAPIRPAATSAIPTPASIRGVRPASAPAALPEGCILLESFEDWDGEDALWLPEGWTRLSQTDSELTDGQRWGVSSANPFLPAPADGTVYAGVSFASVPQDEWLVTPELTIAENQQLSFYNYIDPVFLFDMNYVDWDAYEFTEKHISATLKVMVQPEGGEWTEVWDAATPFMDVPLAELLYMTPESMQETIVNLNEFAGKKVRIAFRYVGTDGNTMFIDLVSVSLPRLDALHYSNPLHTLYWGYDRSPGWAGLNLPVAQYPVYTPIVWTNDSPYSGATYSWTYCDPITAAWVNSDAEELSVTYVPDYSTTTSTKNNLFYPPILNGSMPGASDGTYQAPYRYFQAGGTAEITLTDGEWAGGLLPFEHNAEGLTFLTVESDFGELDTPITGYNKNTDAWWYAYTFPGENNPDYESYVDGCLNFIYPVPGAPLVVDGVTALARGKMADDAELTISIVPLSETFEPLYDKTLVTKTITGADVIGYDPIFDIDFLTLPFDFDSPVAIDETYPGYMVILSGYHSDKVEYFAPMQSEIPNADYLCFGYLVKKTKYDSDTHRTSYFPLAYIEGQYGDCYNAFALHLNAHYGWLKADTETVTVPADGTPVSVVLDSYWAGEALTASELPGVKAVLSGRYGNTVMTLSRDTEHPGAVDGALTVSAPAGHSVAINVHSDGAGVDNITAPSDATVTDIYTVAGVRIAPDTELEPGVYMVRYSDGSVRKIQK